MKPSATSERTKTCSVLIVFSLLDIDNLGLDAKIPAIAADSN
ncbi:MAG: hypothetical protein ACD_33C00008G0008 [uncultured bacterium]|nr:MAG: hypothetical protein ACD_33C00008G0008 [uncultured bacterium]